MNQPNLLWIDLRRRRTDAELPFVLSVDCRVLYLVRVAELRARIEEDGPAILCFDLDFPGSAELRIIERTKLTYPALPLLVLTEEHSESLFIWALRSRVWDCLIKPVPVDAIRGRIHDLVTVLAQSPRFQRKPVMPGDCPRPWFTPIVRTEPERILLPALHYIEQHFSEPIRLRTVAALCGRSSSEFSRLFHRVHGMTFRKYLLRLRLLKARDLLSIPGAAVNDVGMCVGFRDASHFARMFRRETGQSPSEFRRGAAQHEA